MKEPIDKKLATHVAEWWSRARFIDENLQRFTPEEKEAYTYIRHLFDSADDPDSDLLDDYRQTLAETAGECPDEFGAALKTFVQKVRFISADPAAFRRAVNAERGIDEGPVTETRKIGANTWTGSFIKGKAVGSGKIMFAGGAVYEGEWSSDGPHGKGVLTFPSGEKWTATFRNGDPVNGEIKYADGPTYNGEMNENGAHGNGVKRFARYTATGRFENNMMTGSGKIVWTNGDRFEGTWNERNDGFYGKGTYTFSNGTSQTGRFEKNDWIADNVEKPGNGSGKERLFCFRNLLAWTLSAILVAIIFIALIEKDLPWWSAVVALAASMVANQICNSKVGKVSDSLKPAFICSTSTMGFGISYILGTFSGDYQMSHALTGAGWIIAGCITIWLTSRD